MIKRQRVQRDLTRPAGVRVQRVQKVQRVQRVEVGAYELIKGASLYKTIQPPWRALEMHPPLVAGATTFLPQAGALWVLSHGAMSLQECIE